VWVSARLSAGEHGIHVNGINPDAVVRGSRIFAAGWAAQRAAGYGVPEDRLGGYYAQRTLLKREVLPEHVAAVIDVVGGAGGLARKSPRHDRGLSRALSHMLASQPIFEPAAADGVASQATRAGAAYAVCCRLQPTATTA
jgi:hypothetical protein